MPRKPKKRGKGVQLRSTNWVFTLNNYTEEDLDLIFLSVTEENAQVAFIACELEVGRKKKTPHVQGYCQTFDRSMI